MTAHDRLAVDAHEIVSPAQLHTTTSRVVGPQIILRGSPIWAATGEGGYARAVRSLRLSRWRCQACGSGELAHKWHPATGVCLTNKVTLVSARTNALVRVKSEVNDELSGQTRVVGPGGTAVSRRAARATISH